jgi:hypothetical protein
MTSFLFEIALLQASLLAQEIGNAFLIQFEVRGHKKTAGLRFKASAVDQDP